MSSSEQVFTGFWTNWEKGRVLGATLTLRNGAYLVAFLAMFVRVVGSHFWRLLCYLAFRFLDSSSDSSHQSWKQQKAVLRNDFSTMTSSMKFIAIARRSRNEPFRKRTPLVLASIGILNAIAFMLAGLFSSAVTQRSSSVLLQPSTCGQWGDLASITADHWNTSAVIEGVDFASMMRQNLITSSRLYRTCNESSSLLENCFALGDWPLLPFPVDVPGPFGDELCAVEKAVTIDSGYLNSRKHLGINAPQADSVDFRRTITCAPLSTRGFSSDFALGGDQSNDETTSQNFTGYYYGMNLRLSMQSRAITLTSSSHTLVYYELPTYKSTDMSSTYSYSDGGRFETSLGTTVDKWSYELDVEAAAFNMSTGDSSLDSSSSFKPIKKLRKPFSTIVLAFLVKRSKYLSPVLDPWFRAETPRVLDLPITATQSRMIDVFTAKDDPVAVLGCLEQVEFCNPNNSEQPCTFVPVTHHLDVFTHMLDFNAEQKGVAQRIFRGLTRTALAQTIYSLGSQGLMASSTIENILPSPALATDQWKLEVRNWFGASLAGLQLLTVQDITGYGNSDFNQYVTAYSGRNEWMCENQVVHRSDFASFSVLGLCIILFVGCFIIVLSEGLYHILPLLQRPSAGKLRRDQEWRTFDILELAGALSTSTAPHSFATHGPDSVSQDVKFRTCCINVLADEKH